MLLDGCIRWIVRWILIRSQWMLVESIGSSWIQLDTCVSQLDPCISQWILVGSMCIQLDPCISQQSLYRPQYIHYQILVDPCRSLVYPLYPYQSTLSLSIHSYPLLSTLSIYSISFNIHSMQQIYFAFFIKALLNMRIFRIFPLFTSRKLLQPIKSIQNTSIPLIDIIPINWNSFQSSCTCHHVHPSFFSKSLLINVDDSIQYNNQLLFFLFIV